MALRSLFLRSDRKELESLLLYSVEVVPPNDMKRVLIIAGPSAVGKTTIAHELIKNGGIPFELVRSVTTRAPRGDAYDAEYIYLTGSEFSSLMECGGVLEHTEYAGEHYGTPLSEVERITQSGKYPLLILDLEGVKSLSENSKGVYPCSLYIHDDISVMDKRLEMRYESVEKNAATHERLGSRKAQNRKDYANIEKYSCHFYAFVENCREISDTAKTVEQIFCDFLSDVEKDHNAIESVARSLVTMSAK